MMCYCILNYDDNLIFVVLYIKISCIIVFIKNYGSMISWYSLSQFFEAVKELHEVQFSILINRTNLHLLLVFQQARKDTCQYLSTIKVKQSSIIFPKKHSIFHHIFNNSAQGQKAEYGSYLFSFFLGESEYEFALHRPLKIRTVFRSVLTIRIGSLQENSVYRKIRESLFGKSGVGSCTNLSNQCMFGLANKQARRYAPANELYRIRFWTLIFRELVWHISTQVNAIFQIPRLRSLTRGTVSVGASLPLLFMLWSIRIWLVYQ